MYVSGLCKLLKTRFARCFCCLSGICLSSKLEGFRRALHAPEPTQYIHRENRNTRTGSNAGERLFCTGFAVREAVAADHNCNQTCNLRNGASEKTLVGVEAGVE